MNRPVMPASIAPPAAAYSHAVLSVRPERLLHTAGVVPVAPDGTTPATVEAQAVQIWTNIGVILAEAEMAIPDIVNITTYVVVGEDLGPVMAARNEALAGHQPASTLITVPALARPQYKVEIAVVAAR
jgi:enamine deaminase RidA (YjgF/YER057c/UK114 family)